MIPFPLQLAGFDEMVRDFPQLPHIAVVLHEAEIRTMENQWRW
jgi:hypothetical protein